jgi:hypothetical protein
VAHALAALSGTPLAALFFPLDTNLRENPKMGYT